MCGVVVAGVGLAHLTHLVVLSIVLVGFLFQVMTQRLKLSGRIPMYEQAKYKYILYVEGHCAAARYASMMAFGSVIIKVP